MELDENFIVTKWKEEKNIKFLVYRKAIFRLKTENHFTIYRTKKNTIEQNLIR
jgi:hypothetical protein